MKGEGNILIRNITIDDAENLLYLVKQVESQSDYMLMEAGERKTTPEQQRAHLESMLKQNNSTIFVAEEKDTFIGYVIAIGGSVKRTKHTAYLVLGILREYRGRGLGTKLLQQVSEWAKKQHVIRLELTVVTVNKAAVALYKKAGFIIEGTRKHSLMIDGKAFDEYYMAKIL